MADMTPAQVDLARRALGLDGRKRSYRNRYIGSPRHPEWAAMVAGGFAEQHSGKEVVNGVERNIYAGGADLFTLTLAGAKAALRPGESLDPEDFPEASHG